MTDGAIDAVLAYYRLDDRDIRQALYETAQALKLLDSKLAEAGLDQHARRNVWQALLPLDPDA